MLATTQKTVFPVPIKKDRSRVHRPTTKYEAFAAKQVAHLILSQRNKIQIPESLHALRVTSNDAPHSYLNMQISQTQPNMQLNVQISPAASVTTGKKYAN
jgi:hypothetical protein